MTNSQLSRADAVICGAGIAGVAAAWQLCGQPRFSRVVVVDPREALSLTSNRPEANYRDWWPQPEMAALADRSITLMEALRAENETFAMDRRGYLYVTADPARAEAFRTQLAQPQARFARAKLLEGRAIRAAYPHLASDLVAALRVGRAGGIDTVALGLALLRRAQAHGTSVLRASVDAIGVEHGRVAEVVVSASDGMSRIATPVFINAAGPFARDVGALAGDDLPLETVLRGKLVIRDERRIVPRAAPFTIDVDSQTLSPLTEPLPGGVHVKPDSTAGADAIKLGWAWDQRAVPPSHTPSPRPDFPAMVVRGAAHFIPDFERYVNHMPPIMAHDVGFYARTPDGRPLIGRTRVEGSFVLVGLAGFGSMMACAAAEQLAGVITAESDRDSGIASAFSPARFEHPAYRALIASGATPTGEL